MAETVRKNLGMVTAYAYAVSKGYSGTEEEFAELMASYADVAQDAETSAQAAAQSATTAEQKATQAAGSATNAAVSATSASESAQAAAGSSNSASLYAQNASASATNAAGSASSASTYAGNASASAQAAAGSANDAQASATQAAGSAITATAKAGEAATNATTAVEAAQRAEDAAATLVIDNTLTHAGQAADAKKTGDEIGDLKESITQINNIEIENYEHKIEIQNGAYHAGYLYSGSLIAASAWNCREVDVTPNTTYYITGDGNPAFTILDENGAQVYSYNPGVFVPINNYTYKTPDNAAKIFINGTGSHIPQIIKYYDWNFVTLNNLGIALGNDEYNVGSDNGFTQRIGLHSSQNGCFNFQKLNYDGTTFKAVADDISPVEGDCGFIAGNHGYYYGYQCTSTSHGLTITDIGKTSVQGQNEWILLQVIDNNTFVIGCLNPSAWFGLKTETVPSSINFGTNLNITASTRIQLRPSVKNRNTVLLQNTSTVFIVLDEYDVPDIGQAIDAMQSNIGYNDNDSIATLGDPLFHIRTIYYFSKNGSTTCYCLLEVLKDNQILISSYAGSQSSPFATTDLIAALGTIANTLQNSVLNFTKDRWTDQNKAPFVFVQTDNNKSKGMATVYINDRSNYIANSAGYVNSSSHKLYPNMVQPNSRALQTYENIILRMPFVKNNNGADFVSYAKVGNDIYVFIGLLTAKTVSVTINENIYGKTVEEIAISNCSLENSEIITGINITSTGEGYALLKIS